MAARSKVLVVEDEPAIRTGLCDVLTFHGFDVTGVGCGREGLEAALTGRYPLLVLDVMLPEVDGFTICRRARERHPGLAILILTAKGAETDALEGFRCGADDYVTKPFSVSLLMARVHALTRRIRARSDERFRMGPLEIDTARLCASAGSTSVMLTPRNIELLAYLAGAPGRVIGRPELLTEVWGYARVDGVETRCVDMHIAKLRRKLARVTDATIIETVRGAGYRWPG